MSSPEEMQLADDLRHIVAGHRLATVWPPEAAPLVRKALGGAHIIGPQRTLTQDVSFGFDQLAEIAIRALSPAVNDPFTAMTCIDWLGETRLFLRGAQQK